MMGSTATSTNETFECNRAAAQASQAVNPPCVKATLQTHGLNPSETQMFRLKVVCIR